MKWSFRKYLTVVVNREFDENEHKTDVNNVQSIELINNNNDKDSFNKIELSKNKTALFSTAFSTHEASYRN